MSTFLEAKASRNIVKIIQVMINYLRPATLKVDGIIGPLTFSEYAQLSPKGKKVIEAIAAYHDFSMAGEYARFGARSVAAKLPSGQPAAAQPGSMLSVASYPAGSDPRAFTNSAAGVAAFRKSLGASKIAANKAAVASAISRAGFTGNDNKALVAWIGVESAGTWDSRVREGGVGKGVGGFGFSQWTGKRASALVAYAKSVGRSPVDMKTQLDFFVAELMDSQTALKFNGGSVIGRSVNGSWVGGRDALKAALAEAVTLTQKTFVWQTMFFRPAVQSVGKAQAAVKAYA